MEHLIEFILFPDVLGLDVTGPLEVFHTANRLVREQLKTHKGYHFRYSAMSKGPLRFSSGLTVVADSSMDEASHACTLVIPGGSGSMQMMKNSVFMNHVRKKAAKAKRILSVCYGAFILAETGILNGRRATTHWLAADKLARCYPEVNVRADAIFTRDGNIYTSAGVTAGIDLAVAVVEEDFGAAIAMEAARLLVLYYRRPGSQSQFSSPLKAQEAAGRRFSDLHAWLSSRLDKQVSVEDMARFVFMSERNFSRVFKLKTGMTPNRYLETLRLDRAREMMSDGRDSLETIAESSGFVREERLRRAFLRRFGLTPSQYRLHFQRDDGLIPVDSINDLTLKNLHPFRGEIK